MTDGEFERERRQSESIVEDSPDRLVGRYALWADDVTDQLPFNVSTVRLMEGIQIYNPGLEIREDQLEALDAVLEARDNGQNRALVHMATGRGKTTMAAADVKRFLADKPLARVLFLCHQNDILAQARERFEQIVGDGYTYGNFTGESQDYHEVSCLFASFQAMRNWREAFMPNEFDYIVVDESHHGKAPTYEPTLEYFNPDFMLGMTGTPDRHDLKNIREIFGEEIYKLSLEEAIARGLLAEVDYRVILDEIADTRVLRDSVGKRINMHQLDRNIFIPKRDEEIVRIIEEKGMELGGARRIVFCRSIEQVEEYAQYFDNSAPLHSGLPLHEQDKYIDKFRNGEIDTVLTVDMFNEGIDIPDANQVVFLRSTQSKTVFLQQLGRGLRKIPGKESVQVLDFVANCDRLAMLDEVWKDIQLHSAQRNPKMHSQILRINIGDVHFSDAAREILDILGEIENINKVVSDWTHEDSRTYYLALSERLGHFATVDEINIDLRQRHLPSFRFVVAPYGGKLSELRRACGIEIPEGSVSVNQFAVLHDTTPGTVKRVIKELKLELPTFVLMGRKVVALDEKTQQLLATRPEFIPMIPDDHISVGMFAEELGLNGASLRKLIKDAGIPTSSFRLRTHKVQALGPEARDLVRQLPEVRLRTMPEGQQSVARFVNEHKLNRRTVDRYIEMEQLPTELHRSGTRLSTTIGTDVQAQILESLGKRPGPPPEGVVSVYAFAQSYGITSPEPIYKVMKKYGMTPDRYRFGINYTSGLTSEQQDTLRKLPELVLMELPYKHDGQQSVTRFAKSKNRSPKVINRLIQEHDIPTSRYRYGGRIVDGLDSEAQEMLTEMLESD